MILACRQLHKAYGIDVILEKITFHIEEREKAAIVGVNGAGKTTLFKVLTGEISADGGEFYLKKDASLGYLAKNIQIDREENYILITAPNRRVNEKIYITVTCPSCGAKNQIIKGRLCNCEYCGQRLTS